MRVRAKALRVAIVGTAAGILSCAGILDIEDRTKDPGLGPDGGLPVQDGSIANDGTVPTGDDSGNPPPGSDAATPADSGPPGTGADAGPHCAHPPCVLASGLNHPFLLATDANNVYWTEFGTDQGTSDGAVKGCSLSGCATPTTYGLGLINPRGIAVDATNVYFSSSSYSSSGGFIYSCAIAG